jgi:hypothetical protein
MRCHKVLAYELTDKLGSHAHSEYWWLCNGMWLKQRWYGNFVRCPICGLEGRLPIDKPLSTDAILNPDKEDLEMDKRITQKLEEKKRKVNDGKISNEKG